MYQIYRHVEKRKITILFLRKLVRLRSMQGRTRFLDKKGSEILAACYFVLLKGVMVLAINFIYVFIWLVG